MNVIFSCIIKNNIMAKNVKVLKLSALPENPSSGVRYIISHDTFNKDDFLERVKRHLICYLDEEEVWMLFKSIIAVAGMGGMGGLSAATLVRWGFGEVRGSDMQAFDHSNRNRQLGAGLGTIGQSKALVVGKMLLEIANDFKLVIEPRGIVPGTVRSFVSGATRVLDEIEFFCPYSRMLLHEAVRAEDGVILSGSSAGFAAALVKWTKHSMHIEEVLEMTKKEARRFEIRFREEKATVEETAVFIKRMLRIAAPRIPEYFVDTKKYSTVKELLRCLVELRIAPITPSNPVMSAGYLINNLIFDILAEKSDRKRNHKLIPPMPGYKMFDSGIDKVSVVNKQWWNKTAIRPKKEGVWKA